MSPSVIAFIGMAIVVAFAFSYFWYGDKSLRLAIASDQAARAQGAEKLNATSVAVQKAAEEDQRARDREHADRLDRSIAAIEAALARAKADLRMPASAPDKLEPDQSTIAAATVAATGGTVTVSGSRLTAPQRVVIKTMAKKSELYRRRHAGKRRLANDPKTFVQRDITSALSDQTLRVRDVITIDYGDGEVEVRSEFAGDEKG